MSAPLVMTGSLDNVDVLAERLTTETLESYSRRREPFVVRGLLNDAPVSELHSEAQAERLLGDMELILTDEFSSQIFDRMGGSACEEVPADDTGDICNLREYLDNARRNPRNRKVVSVLDTPSELRRMIPAPDCLAGHQVISKLFLGKSGDYAHLHFDTDGRDVLLHQVFGHKRFVVISERETRKLSPLGNYSAVFLENILSEDRRAFLDYVRARECLLGPGDTLFIPQLAWHAADYLDTAMSVNLRFNLRPSKYLQFLVDHVHRNDAWQALAVLFADEERVREAYLPHFIELAFRHFAPYSDGADMYHDMQESLAAIHLETCPEELRSPLVFRDFGDWEERIFPKPSTYRISGDELRTGPLSDATRRLPGAITPTQERFLKTWQATDHRHSHVLEAALRRLFPSRSSGDLTMQEAKTLILALKLA